MPNTSLVLSGTVNGRDAAAVASGTVRVFNFTKGNETAKVNIDSNGQYSIDLANLPTQWAINDIIYVVAESGSYSGVIRWKIGSTDDAEVQNIFLKPFSYSGASTTGTDNKKVIYVSFMGAAVAGTAFDFLLIERATDKVIGTLKCATNGQATYSFNYPGHPCYGGFYLLRTATSAAATANPNNQTEAIAGAIGDTTTNAQIFTTVTTGG